MLLFNFHFIHGLPLKHHDKLLSMHEEWPCRNKDFYNECLCSDVVYYDYCAIIKRDSSSKTHFLEVIGLVCNDSLHQEQVDSRLPSVMMWWYCSGVVAIIRFGVSRSLRRKIQWDLLSGLTRLLVKVRIMIRYTSCCLCMSSILNID